MTAPAHPRVSPSIHNLVAGVLSGSFRDAGRVISLVENRDSAGDEVIRQLYAHTGRSYAIGFTGPPGAGKSSLVDDLVQVIRERSERAGIIAVDPNSPFSGGAILGDRIRMFRHTVDPDVFIRSMGSRGHLGGVAVATSRAMYVFDALGMNYTILETVGVGQSELEVADLADTTVVVVMPGLGDSVQTIKAGIMEIADIFVINKSDLPSVAKTAADLRELLRLDTRSRSWIPPIVKTVATKEEGVTDLWAAIERHRRYLAESGDLMVRRRKRLERQILDIATRELRERVLLPNVESTEFQNTIEQVLQRRLDPQSAVSYLLQQTTNG